MWCVIHVEDRAEARMEDFLKGLLSGRVNARCFHVTRDRRKKFEGQWRTVREDLFPGYVFIDTDQPERVHRELKKAPGRGILFSDDRFVATLERRESDVMERVADRDGLIGLSTVRVGGDGSIQCLSGPLANVKDRVRKVNLHRRVAELEISLLGQKRTLHLGIEIER